MRATEKQLLSFKEYYIKNKTAIINRSRQRYQNKREEILEKQMISHFKNRESNLKQKKKYYYENIDSFKRHFQENKEKHNEWQRQHRKKNSERINKRQREYIAKRKATNPSIKLAYNIRGRIRMALKRNSKSDKTNILIGCEIQQLKIYLENKFSAGMSWDNYSLRGWHIDHIKPCALFDLSKPEEQRKCFHYTNLQPLWGIENIRKGKKYNG